MNSPNITSSIQSESPHTPILGYNALQLLHAMEVGRVYTRDELTNLTSSNAIGSTLYRLLKHGYIERLATNAYQIVTWKPGDPEPWN